MMTQSQVAVQKNDNTVLGGRLEKKDDMVVGGRPEKMKTWSQVAVKKKNDNMVVGGH